MSGSGAFETRAPNDATCRKPPCRPGKRATWREMQHLRPPKRLSNHNLAGRINPVDKTLLAKSRPIVVICIADSSHFARERLMAFTLWHPDAVSGAIHLIWSCGIPELISRRTNQCG